MKHPATFRRLLRVALAVCPSSFLLSVASGTLDLTLQHKQLAADGIAQDEVYITDGPSKIFLRFPPDWQVFNSEQALDFIPSVAGSKVRLERDPADKPLTIDAAGVKALAQQVAAQLPVDAKNVAPLDPVLDALAIFGWKSMEVGFHYEYYGQALRRSVLYLNMLPGRVVKLTVIAPEADFDKVHKQARGIASSWFEPSRDLPPELQKKYDAPLVPGE